MIAGGEAHKAGQGGDTPSAYSARGVVARARFDVSSIEYRWSTQDNMPVDGVPFIGRMLPLQQGRLGGHRLHEVGPHRTAPPRR